MEDSATRAEHYRSTAEETRAIAASLKHAETKIFLIGVMGVAVMMAELVELMGDPIPASE